MLGGAVKDAKLCDNSQRLANDADKLLTFGTGVVPINIRLEFPWIVPLHHLIFIFSNVLSVLVPSNTITPMGPNELGAALNEALLILKVTVRGPVFLGLSEILPPLARHL